MAVTYVGGHQNAAGSGNTNDMAMTLPTHQADDFAVIMAGYRNSLSATMGIGTATGWTLLRTDDDISGDDTRTYVWYKRLTSSSETSPAVTIDLGRNRSGLMLVFRGVDTTTAFDVTETFTSGTNDATPTPAAITPVTASGALILTHFHSQQEITTSGVPATPGSMITGPEVLTGSGNTLVTSAYLADYGSAATITPTAFTHSVSANLGEYHCYTIALRPATAGAAGSSSLMLMGVG